jgi:glycolate oxidase subunit GlcD
MTGRKEGVGHTVLDTTLVRSLAEIVGTSGVITETGRLLPYESDALTRFRELPRAVVLPRDTAEASRVVTLLVEAGLPLTPRGSGTGLSGGGVVAPGGVLVGTSRMNRILALDPARRLARVQAGVINSDLSTAAAPHGLHYAPDPSSQAACTLGGNVGENAGGPHCLKYGVTTRYVTGLTVVTGTGEVLELGGDGRCESLDVHGIFVGSEGRLGLATEIELRLIPRARGVRTLLAVFDTTEAAGGAVSDIIAAGLLPAAMEIMDQGTIQAVESSIYAAGYPTDAAAVLVVEFDGTEAGLDAEVAAAEAHCRQAGATQLRRARNESERQALWQGRKKAYGAFGRITPDLMVQDATVPRSTLPAVLGRIAEIGRRHDLRVANVFHAGDGNLHPKILFDRRDPEVVKRVERASKEMMQACVEVGGTITGEHGVGLDKRDYMHLVHGPDELDVMRAIQRVFDPTDVWNPGKVLPPASEGGGRIPARGEKEAGSGRDSGDDLRGPEPSGSGSSVGPGAVRPGVVVEPRSAEEVRSVLAEASREGITVRIRGAHPPGEQPEWVTMVTSGLPQEVRHAPPDLTVTVSAGCRVGILQEHLAETGQWLPLDAPASWEWTVGEMVARGEWGALAPAYGRVRDLLLGAELVSGDGRPLRLGGQVMKNVAGFDLVRGVAGSRGRWGAITSATFRLMPLPRAHSVLTWEGSAEAMTALAQRLAGHPILPASLVRVVDSETSPRSVEEPGGGAASGRRTSRQRVLVRILGSEPTVAAETAELEGDFPGADVWTSRPRDAGFLQADPVSRAMEGAGGGEFGRGEEGSAGTLLELRSGDLATPAVDALLRASIPEARSWVHLPLAGVWRVALGEIPSSASLSLTSLRDELRGSGGDLGVLRGDAHIGDGVPEEVATLERRICDVFDPARVLARSREVRSGAGPGRE